MSLLVLLPMLALDGSGYAERMLKRLEPSGCPGVKMACAIMRRDPPLVDDARSNGISLVRNQS